MIPTTTQKTTEHGDTMIDYVDTIASSVYIARNPDISDTERRKLLREVEDDLYNLKHYIINKAV